MAVKKKAPKKDVSNAVVALVLVVAIILSIAGTLIVIDNLSLMGKINTAGIKKTVKPEELPLSPAPVLGGGTIGITVQKPN